VVEVVKRRVVSRTHRRQQGHEEMVVVMRSRDRDNQQVVKVDYALSNAAPATPLWQCARVAKADHRIEDCRQRSKSEAGLAADEVRHWTGWQQHQTLSRLATWFLVQETERGKKWTLAMTLPQIRQGIAVILREAYHCDTRAHLLDTCQKRLRRNELARF
jgi:SRSO17 transposase